MQATAGAAARRHVIDDSEDSSLVGKSEQDLQIIHLSKVPVADALSGMESNWQIIESSKKSHHVYFPANAVLRHTDREICRLSQRELAWRIQVGVLLGPLCPLQTELDQSCVWQFALFNGLKYFFLLIMLAVQLVTSFGMPGSLDQRHDTVMLFTDLTQSPIDISKAQG